MSKNHLASATSPYLLQHADNPVHWYEWGEEALNQAKMQNKPILLSIGYSACHWCHVMAHESFESEETAWLMNELFINIKVDREERPDLDKLYQTAHALISQRNGGWPLTMFLSPEDQMPFFGGTYFPDEPRHGLPAFRVLIQRVSDYFQQHRDEISKQNLEMASTFGRIYGNASSAEEIDAAVLDTIRSELSAHYDQVHGGFGGAPKFPQVGSLERLMRHWAATSLHGDADTQALDMVTNSLVHMSEGGLFDQLGGGYCRYSVDDLWMIPHFEKMLYDNGPLLALVSDLYAATGDERLRRAALKTADWVMREMQSGDGGYYSALDADSEGEEGKFYRWDRREIQQLLDDNDYPIFERRYGLNQTPNFEGFWHLHGFQDPAEIAAELGKDIEEIRRSIEASEQKLFDLRDQRVHPGLDDKQLTSWNALMIRGMLRAARVFEKPEYAASAMKALDFIRTRLWDGQRLLAAARGERAHLNAYLDDYAYLIDALIESLQWRWNSQHLAMAQELSEALLRHFSSEHGGFYFTSDDHEQLIERPRGFADEAMPSGNAIATRALLRLGYLLAEPRYLDAAERSLQAGMFPMKQNAMAHASLVNALEEQIYPPVSLIVRGSEESLKKIRTHVNKAYTPRLLCYLISNEVRELPEALADKKPVGTITAYACEGVQCRAPMTDEEEIIQLIEASSARV